MIGNKLTPFKFWCQKVLPTVYDDSLSYYEYLCKLNEYLNEVITQINTLTQAEEDFQADLSQQWEDYKTGLNDDWLEYKTGLTDEWNTYQRELTEAWLETKGYIDHYFDNLNVQTEINNKLDAMVLDGTMGNLIDAVISDDIPTTVTTWLTQHVDPVGSAVVVDDTLTISGAAADSKTVGDEFKNCLRSTGINVRHDSLHDVTDLDTVESNTIYSIEGDITESDVAHLPIYGNGGYLLITESLYSDHIYGRVQFFYSLTGKNDYKRTARYAGYGVTPEYVYTPWKIIDDSEVLHDTIDFDYDHRLHTTSIQLQAGVKYGIYMNNFGTPISVFINGYSSVYSVSTDYEYIEFTPQNSGFLNVYDVDRVGGRLNIDVYSGKAKQLFEEKERVYTVGTGKDYTTITGCFKALARDNFKKTIYIEGGTYDIEQEYASNNIPVCPDNVDPVQNYIPYNVFVPTNAHVIGKGNVVMKYEPLPQNVTPHQAYAISTLNVLGSCIVENITLLCKNGRYCLHDDCLDKTVYNGSTHVYKNVTMIKYVSDNESGGTEPLGTAYCTGFGFNPNILYELDNCVLVNKASGGVFYGHNRPVINNVRYGVEQSPKIVLKDCVFEKTSTGNSVELHNAQASLQGQTKIETHISNCWANGNIALVESTPNGYQLIIQKTDYDEVYIQDSSNIYTPWIYN